MATAILIPVSEYLESVYRPDCDYLEGELVERNVGERDHSRGQTRIVGYLFNREAELGIHVYAEMRVQVRRDRYRVPDVCVVLGSEPDERVFTAPPFLCVEILSPRDSMTSMQERIDDYFRFGVSFVWVIDPRLKRAFIYSPGQMREATEALSTANPEIRVPLSAIF